MFDAAIFDSAIFSTDGSAQAVGKGRKLSFEEAQAIHERQTRRKALPDVDAQPTQKRRRDAQGATEGPSAPTPRVEFADSFTAPASLPSLADVRAAIAEAQQAAQRAASVASAIQLQRAAQEAQAAELAEEEAVAMLVLMMEAA